MSMTSAQYDELRYAADQLKQLIDNGHNYTSHGAINTERLAEQCLRQAADTILELLERIHELEMEGSDNFYRAAYAEDANRTLEDENERLRELVRDMWRPASYQVTGLQYENFKKRMRELGLEES